MKCSSQFSYINLPKDKCRTFEDARNTIVFKSNFSIAIIRKMDLLLHLSCTYVPSNMSATIYFLVTDL
jgi:hypothetical protein